MRLRCLSSRCACLHIWVTRAMACSPQAKDILQRAFANDSTASPDMIRQGSHSAGDPSRLHRVLGKLLRGGQHGSTGWPSAQHTAQSYHGSLAPRPSLQHTAQTLSWQLGTLYYVQHSAQNPYHVSLVCHALIRPHRGVALHISSSESHRVWKSLQAERQNPEGLIRQHRHAQTSPFHLCKAKNGLCLQNRRAGEGGGRRRQRQHRHGRGQPGAVLPAPRAGLAALPGHGAAPRPPGGACNRPPAACAAFARSFLPHMLHGLPSPSWLCALIALLLLGWLCRAWMQLVISLAPGAPWQVGPATTAESVSLRWTHGSDGSIGMLGTLPEQHAGYKSPDLAP